MDEALALIKEALPLIRENDDFELAKEMKRLLSTLMKDLEDQKQIEKLKNYEKELDVYVFRYFEELEMIDYFSNDISKVLQKKDINFIIESIKYFLYSYYAVVDYQEIREKLLQRIYENKEQLTETTVLYKSGKEVPGTIRNWFKHYQLHFDHNKEFRIGMMEYLDSNIAIQQLNKQEKQAVKNLIYVVEYLRTDVEDIFAQEADLLYKISDDLMAGYIDGERVEIKTDPFVKKVRNYTKKIKKDGLTLAESLKEGVEEVDSIDKEKTSEKVLEEDKSLKRIKHRIQLSEEEKINLRNIIKQYKTLKDEEILDYLWEGIDSYNKYLVIGALRELAKRKKWEEIWDVPRLRLLLNDYRSRKLKTLSFDPNDNKQKLKVLLKFLLEHHLSLPKDNAKKWALYLVSWLEKNGYEQYSDLVYFDADQGHLEWE